MSDFKDKIRSVNFGAGRPARTVVDGDKDVKHVELVSEIDGSTAGFQTVHPSGRVDCTMTPAPLNVSLSKD